MDKEIFDLIEQEKIRQESGLELIASENYVSNQVLKAMGSPCTNKYAEGYSGHRYYGGCEVIDKIENLAISRLRRLYGCEYANVQPHSGSQANRAVIEAVCEPGDTILSLHLDHGGHLTHGSPVSFSGKYYHIVNYYTNENGYVDYTDLTFKAVKYRPKLIIAGASAYSREWEYNKLRKAADSCGAILLFDMAHTAGLIAAGILENPCKYCDIVTSTTHKTLRGPRGGIILLPKDFEYNGKLMSKRIDSSVFPGNQGGPLEHVIAAKAVCFYEAMQPEFVDYQKQVVSNAKTMCGSFIDKGYKIISEGTDNHLMLIDLRTKYPQLTGKLAEKELGKALITVNKNMVPSDNRSPFQTSGLRIGTPAVTTRGMKEKEMLEIVELIDTVLSSTSNCVDALNAKDDILTAKQIKDLTDHHRILKETLEKVKNLTSKFPLNY